ncbi:RNA exonuclease ngl2 [Thecaphora frezii]
MCAMALSGCPSAMRRARWSEFVVCVCVGMSTVRVWRLRRGRCAAQPTAFAAIALHPYSPPLWNPSVARCIFDARRRPSPSVTRPPPHLLKVPRALTRLPLPLTLFRTRLLRTSASRATTRPLASNASNTMADSASPTPASTTVDLTDGGGGEPNGKAKAKGGGKGAQRPSAEEIEAKRAARALKKQKEAEEKAAKEAALRRSLLDSGDADGRLSDGHLDANGTVLYVPRSWATVSPRSALPANGARGRKIKVLSWNILAQGLVRRKLFPGSDCLKFKDRSAGLTAEFSSRTGHGWDVGCFQEVDRMDVHGETLARDHFAYVYEKGYHKKQHGLLVAWRKSLFGDREHSRLVVDLDEESVCEPGPDGVRRRTACSRITRNVGLFVSLRFADGPAAGPSSSSGPEAAEATAAPPGIIVATTHLFWHPMHAYERARQSGILVRRLDAYRRSLGLEWSEATIVLAGDFNDQPHSATYHLLTGKRLTPHCLQELRDSTVVHKSVGEKAERARAEPAAADAADAAGGEAAGDNDEAADEDGEGEEGEKGEEGEEEEEGEGGADDRMLKNCRAATAEDGLLSIEELLQLHDLSRPLPGSTPAAAAESGLGDLEASRLGLMSAYGSMYGHVVDPPETDNFFGTETRGRERHDDETWSEGQRNVHTGDCKEPMWTIFSSLFSLTLDYIFLFPTSATVAAAAQRPTEAGGEKSEAFPRVTRLLRTHRTETLSPGVPRKGVCASDHVAVAAEVVCSTASTP